jgi:hypothetical protein
LFIFYYFFAVGQRLPRACLTLLGRIRFSLSLGLLSESPLLARLIALLVDLAPVPFEEQPAALIFKELLQQALGDPLAQPVQDVYSDLADPFPLFHDD